MTIDHDTFDDRLANLVTLDHLPDDLADHAESCARCQGRLDLARRIRSTAPDLVGPQDESDAITNVVLARTQNRSTALPKLLAVAAAAIVVVAGATFALTNSSDQADVLAQIADDYADSGSVRFVYATEATINVVDEFDLAAEPSNDLQAMSVQIPTCADDPGAGVTDGELDLAPIVDALASNDPCLALRLIDESATPAREAFAALAATIQSGQDNIDDLTAASPKNELAAATADAYIEDQQKDIARAQQALTDLEQTFAALARTVEPLTDAATSQTVGTASIETGLQALRADTSAAQQNLLDADPVVVWTQIATGTWTPNVIEISGITERNDTTNAYDTVDADPLALADVVLATPATLIALLDSAPNSEEDTVNWTVPDGILGEPGTWNATARISSGQLIDLVLKSTTSTITFTPQS